MLIMALCCLPADYFAPRALGSERFRSLLTSFRVWLLVVVALVFCLTNAVTFNGISVREWQTADVAMKSETAYVCTQLKNQEEELASLEKEAGGGEFLDRGHPCQCASRRRRYA